MSKQITEITQEIQKVIVGKKPVIEKILMAIIADGHILLDDVPGVGKTTLAVALARTMGLNYSRIQFTPDVLPSDIVGFSMYRQQTGDFVYMPGAVTAANLVLADEINRTSSKTQSALLEAMEERQVTVDGTVHPLNKPFIVIATQNQVGAAGTQLLPHAQLDRFLVKLTIGYPDLESEVEILRGRRTENPADTIGQVADLQSVLKLQETAANVTIKDEILEYITRLAADSRENEYIQLGISPRGSLAVSKMARACALVHGRDYVIPEDVQEVFTDVCAHRIILGQKARNEHKNAETILRELLREIPLPYTK